MIPTKSVGGLRRNAVVSGRFLLVILTTVFKRHHSTNPGIMKKKVRHVSVLVLCVVLLLCSGIKGSAFTLIGPNNPGVAINGANWVTANNSGYYQFTPNAQTPTPLNGTQHQGFLNHMDPMGWPVPIKQFYRWNFPELWYSFDNTFVQYFGQDGMQAVHDAFEVLNDYFDPQDKSYSGVSSMDLLKEFDQHFSTWKFNPSAEAAAVYDMKTIVLGLLVNHMGLGNPHRHCYTIRDIYGYAEVPGAPGGLPAGQFQVAVRNYDPYTYQPASVINGVTYSYFIRADIFNVNNVPNPNAPRVFDAVEYSVDSENKFSAIAGIRDIIIIPNSLPWPGDPMASPFMPTAYGAGRYVAPNDPKNKPAPSNFEQQLRTQPRHTLTFDDAGGLRYLYRTNNIVWETYDAQVQLIQVANMNPEQVTSQGGRSNPSFPTHTNRVILGSAGNIYTRLPFGQLRHQPSFTAGALSAFQRIALRGGIDKIKCHYLPYDSLLGLNYHTNISVWRDVFVTNMLPTDVVPANPPYFSQIVGRTTFRPDFVFIADDMGGPGGGSFNVIDMPNPGAGPDWDTSLITQNWPQTQRPAGVNEVLLGPGVILPPAGDSIPITFSTRPPILIDIWGSSGDEEQAVHRQDNTQTLMQWGWITNSGPNDYISFPQADVLPELEATLGPAGTVAKITHLKVYDGFDEAYQPEPFDIDRTLDTITIHGQRLDSVTSIKILDHHTIENGAYKTLQTIEARRYIMSDQQIVLPPGILDNTTVSPSGGTYYRRIALVNSKGESNSELIYEISNGRPLVESTQYDSQPLNVAKSLIIQGSGFKLEQGSVNQIWFFDDDTTNRQTDPNSGTGEFPMPVAILDINSTNTAFASTSGVNVDYSEITVTDSMIYLPQYIISDGNYTYGNFGNLGGGPDRNMSRSEGNSTDDNYEPWIRHIRLAYNSDPVGQPNANVIMSPYRPWILRYKAIGIGGDRNSANSRYSSTLPTITDVFTIGAANTDENSTWSRNNATDALVIRGIGLDLAQWFDCVDGLGNPIQTLDTSAGALPPPNFGWVPAWAQGLRAPPLNWPNNVLSFESVLVHGPAPLPGGVTINNYPPLGRDGYEIRIDPVAYGMDGPIHLWDSQLVTTPNNFQDGDRRLVIGTPFGTAIAPRQRRVRILP